MSDKLVSPSSGLNNSDLAKTNAGTGDVIAGKTFYAGDKTLKTGTIEEREAYTDVSDIVYMNQTALVRIPFGAYRTPTIAGKPEIRIPIDNVKNALPGGNQGAWGTRIAAGSSVTIPKGWHNGSGTVTADMGREETVIIFTGSNSTTPINEIVVYQNGSMACERAPSSSGYNNSMVRLNWDGTAYVWTWHMYVNKRSWVYRNNSMVGTYEAGAEFASIAWNSGYVAYRVFPI